MKAKRVPPIPDICFGLAILWCLVSVIPEESRTPMSILSTVLTLLIVLLSLLSKTRFVASLPREHWLFSARDNLKYSMSLFLAGVFFARYYPSADDPTTFVHWLVGGYAIGFTVVLVGSFGYAIVVALYANERTMEELYGEMTGGRITRLDAFLDSIGTSQANRLAVAGNLLALKTPSGLALLEKFLSGGSDNRLELFIPKSSETALSDIKGGISANLLERIDVYIYEPFWFMPGVVLVGDVDPCRANEIRPVGCFFYNPMRREGGMTPKSGVF